MYSDKIREDYLRVIEYEIGYCDTNQTGSHTIIQSIILDSIIGVKTVCDATINVVIDDGYCVIDGYFGYCCVLDYIKEKYDIEPANKSPTDGGWEVEESTEDEDE